MRAIPGAILEHEQFEIFVEKELFNAQFIHMNFHNPPDTRGSDMIDFVPPAALSFKLGIVPSRLI